MIEIWKDAFGLNGIYAVSNLGRIKRTGKSRGAQTNHILAPQNGGCNGKYLKVNLGRKWGKEYIHRMVAFAFIGEPPTKKYEVNHKNGNTKDNRAINLEWVTRSENNYHSYRKLGRKAIVKQGEEQWHSRLKKEDILNIRRLWSTGEYTQKEIGEKYNLLQGSVSNIVRLKSWKHI